MPRAETWRFWDDRTRDLIIEAQCGKGTLAEGDPVPAEGVVRRAWKTDSSQVVKNVDGETDYYRMDPNTCSELAAPFRFKGQKLGVINFESKDRSGFDEFDLIDLEHLGQFAACFTQATERLENLKQAARSIFGPVSDRTELLVGLLRVIERVLHFDAGIIYVADQLNRVLRCMASIGCRPDQIEPETNPEHFTYSYDDKSLATHVWRTRRSLFVKDAETDPVMSQPGRSAFRISGPVLGAPVVIDDQLLGVLVVWSRRHGRVPVESDIRDIEGVATMAAVALRSWEAERCKSVVLNSIRSMLTSLQSEQPRERRLGPLFEALLADGFERVRLLRYEHADRCFVGDQQIGMLNPRTFEGYRIHIDRNRYARHTAEVLASQPQPRAYQYDPMKNPFGPDPDAEALGKPIDLPWAVVPLVVAGRLYGQIACDTLRTRRVITEELLQYMTILGAVAGFALAIDEVIRARAYVREQEFLDRAFHHLRAPTHNLSAYVDSLSLGSPETLKRLQPDEIRKLDELTSRLVRLVEQATRYRRLANAATLHTRGSLANLLAQVRTEFESRARKQGVMLSVNVPDRACEIEGDQDALFWVFSNLVDNALKFSRPDQSISIHLTPTKDSYSISVIDEGPGIPEDQRETIFGQFIKHRSRWGAD